MFSRLYAQAKAKRKAKKYAEAVPLYRHAMQCARGDADWQQRPQVLRCMHSLGHALYKCGGHSEALRVLQECHTLRVRLLGERHQNTMYTSFFIFQCLLSLGRHVEAVREGRGLLPVMREIRFSSSNVRCLEYGLAVAESCLSADECHELTEVPLAFCCGAQNTRSFCCHHALSTQEEVILEGTFRILGTTGGAIAPVSFVCFLLPALSSASVEIGLGHRCPAHLPQCPLPCAFSLWAVHLQGKFCSSPLLSPFLLFFSLLSPLLRSCGSLSAESPRTCTAPSQPCRDCGASSDGSAWDCGCAPDEAHP